MVLPDVASPGSVHGVEAPCGTGAACGGTGRRARGHATSMAVPVLAASAGRRRSHRRAFPHEWQRSRLTGIRAQPMVYAAPGPERITCGSPLISETCRQNGPSPRDVLELLEDRPQQTEVLATQAASQLARRSIVRQVRGPRTGGSRRRPHGRRGRPRAASPREREQVAKMPC